MPDTPAADLVFYGGRILTLDRSARVAEALAVAGERVFALGTSAEMLALAGPGTRRVDLAGRTAVPGLIDAHAHLDREGLKTLCPSLAGARSIDDVLQTIEALVRAAEPGQWIVTMPLGDPPYYFDVPAVLRENRFPTRWELDRVAPRHPVYIRAIWGYWRHTLPLVSIANSEALRRAGITRETLPPWGGVQIDRDWASGEPNGILVEWTYMPLVELTLMAAAPRFTLEDRVRALPAAMRAYNACGTTSTYEGHGIAVEVMAAYETVARRGGLTVRPHLVVSPAWGAGDPASVRAQLDLWRGRAAGRGTGDDVLRVAGLYAEAGPTPDNVVRARARPYTGWAGFNFDSALPRARLREVLLEAARSDLRVASFTADLLPLYEEVDREAPIRDRRWVLGHLGVLTDDEIKRVRDLGLVCSTHTNRHLAKEGELLARRVGAAHEDTIVPLRKLREAGVHVALATDNVPVSLFHPVWHCVARLDRYSGRAIAPAQALTREEALRACTNEGAYLLGEEDRRGSLEPGKLADLAVLSEDPLACALERLPGITADLTLVGGRVVWERG
ncbi:MAG: hypothetical protein A2W08_18970 [Candidatus Rokubacteria bacterium RBG_16_73_20]|nr:MAG: hypothetical protein A2050_02575 [Candidatus Rokubacteria bacterium GWA2_73_35]OGK93496.1 MAG: hypothetical protein A2W08_18970 [Candidatus Rokubacteria bacterium RBG_16_73_20]HBH03779.1 amidohydrolase [Candidatus Rokubacteria bacterium]